MRVLTSARTDTKIEPVLRARKVPRNNVVTDTSDRRNDLDPIFTIPEVVDDYGDRIMLVGVTVSILKKCGWRESQMVR